MKFLYAPSGTIINAAIVVGVLSFASRLFGLVRDRILAGEFGAGDVLDVYYAAFKVPDVLFGLMVVGALSASFIPLFSKHVHDDQAGERAWALANNCLHVIIVGMAGLSVLLFVFVPTLAQWVAPGYEPIKQLQVASFMRVMLGAELLLAISMVFGSVLQSLKRFFLYALAPIFYNLGIIVGALFFVPILGNIGLAWGVVLGAFLHLLIQVFGAYASGWRYRSGISFSDPQTREVFRLMGPRVLGIGVTQIQIVLFTVLASTLAVGSVAVFQFAYNIMFFPVGIFGVSFAIAAFPSFSQKVAGNDLTGLRDLISATVRQTLFFMVPMTVTFLLLRAQIVRVVVGAGAFDWEATIRTADTLAFFALSFSLQALVFILARAFFALQDTLTPLLAGVVSSVVGILASFLLVEPFGVIGLAQAFSLAALIQLAMLWVPLRKRVGSLSEARIVRSLFIMTTAGLFCAIVIQLLKPVAVQLLSLDTFFGVLAQGLLAGGAGLLAYVGVAYFLKSEELLDILGSIKRKVLKHSHPEEIVNI